MGAVRLVHIGVDIGQKHDPTAIVVCQVLERPSNRSVPQVAPVYQPGSAYPPLALDIRQVETYYEARHMERLPLGTAYPDVAERVASVICSPTLLDCTIQALVDETGVGRPVFELIQQAVHDRQRLMVQRQSVRLRPITFTHGDRYDRQNGRLGKAYLVSRLQALFQTTRIKLPRNHAEARAMMQELKDYEIRIDEDANDKYGAFKVGSHDDLATALGLCVIDDPRDYRVKLGPRLY